MFKYRMHSMLHFHLSFYHHHHHHVPEGLGVLYCSLILKMKLVRTPLPWSSRVPSSFWSILYCNPFNGLKYTTDQLLLTAAIFS
jgi:hypothetical protein